MHVTKKMFLVLAGLPALGACANPPAGAQSPNAVESAKRPLDAVLFGYIPDAGGDDFAGLRAVIERDFEARHPEIDLRLVLDPTLDLYDLDDGGQLATFFGEGNGSADVVELDMVLLADLVARGWIAPARVESSGVAASAREATTLGGVSYGAPTYLCGNFVYSHAASLEQAGDATSLLEILGEARPGRPALIGNYAGSWTLPSIYLDAWADGHDNAPGAVQTAYALPLDDTTMGPLGALTGSCAENGANPCLDKTYKDNTGAEIAFAQGGAGGFIGYSERLYYIVKENPAAGLPKVISAPMSSGSKPTLFTDALVTSAQCTGLCREDAERFIAFMSTLAVRRLIAFSQDAPEGAPPRYLLQALEAFYTSEPAASSAIYRALQPVVIREGRAFPNQGFPQARVDLNTALTNALTQ